MAVRRELVYDERGGFAAADKLMPVNETTQQMTTHGETKRRAERARPLIRLGVALFYTARLSMRLSPDTAVCYTVASLVVPFQLPFRSPLVPRKDMRFVLQCQ